MGQKRRYGYRQMSNFLNQIDSLSAAEKIELLDALWQSLEADEVSLTPSQQSELDYRIARHEKDPADVISWKQVRGSLFNKL